MEMIASGVRDALSMILTVDREVLDITLMSLQVSGSATLISLLAGVPVGTLIAFSRFPGRKLVVALVNASMGLPPVVVGLFVTLMLWRSGPFAELRLLYTPLAMVAAQAIIAFPIITALTMASMQQLDPKLLLQLKALGATRLQTLLFLLRETRLPVMAAAMAGFGGVISEVGASMMVGGNIYGQTRVLTTATVLETGKGNFEIAIALSLILLLLTYTVTLTLTLVQQRRNPHAGGHRG